MSDITKCTPDTFHEAVKKALKVYGDHVFEISEQSAKSAARQGASELKRTSPKRTGEYAKNWSHKALRRSIMDYTEIIYNRAPTYRVSHLVEKPHRVNGGHYPRRKDSTGIIAAVEDKYSIKFYEGVISKL